MTSPSLSPRQFAILITILFILFLPEKLFAADIGLIETKTLNQDLSSWMVLDARPVKKWQEGHVPGAKSFSWESYTRTDVKGVPYRVVPPVELADALSKLGIDENTPIVVYGDADTSWGGEGWACWVLDWIGHQGNIRLLDGGWQDWIKHGFKIVSGDEKRPVKEAVYQLQVRNLLNITAEEIRNNTSNFQIVDTRSTLEWLKGHIPNAVHIRWENFYDGKRHSPLNPSAVKSLLESNGINPDKPVVYYCTGGIRSGYAWLVHHLGGLPEAVNFEGGIAEWETIFPLDYL